MRSHVEMVHEQDLIWHAPELPRGEGRARQQNLSYDEENGAGSFKVFFETDWGRPGGYHSADTEWFVLQGRVHLGDTDFGPGGYWRAPAGLRIPHMRVESGTEVLIFREYGDWGFSVADRDRSDFISKGGNTVSTEPGELTIVHSEKMDFIQNKPERGLTQQFLSKKDLFFDWDPNYQTKGFRTFVCHAPPGWGDERLIHHPVFEEAYCLSGSMTYNYGPISPGVYFWRPAKVKHGSFLADNEEGTTWIFRLDGDLINWVTLEPEVIVKGIADNYDPDDPDQAPEIAGIPTRSRSIGPWDGYGR